MGTLTQMSLKKDYDSYLARVALELKSGDVADTQAEALATEALLHKRLNRINNFSSLT